ncbi:uncharacterized protein MELLADRAFT_71740 [Melampsora larici-populina 98AG31]|uniref:Uncharacterized protein n=1 Tax=Melampsora larici-populina (strain 98AG31 / pathotype 3-4-7) TaxID=747676 RepID=F4RJY7_MELLP|nr:uncharacterized protein MELLADRAFT_71740 [Melampsora larici-populina 98AG31]EGG07414.1 hypothetical protein MELLADRAFT_71740 [Melampsora larici-populina 98AG31]
MPVGRSPPRKEGTDAPGSTNPPSGTTNPAATGSFNPVAAPGSTDPGSACRLTERERDILVSYLPASASSSQQLTAEQMESLTVDQPLIVNVLASDYNDIPCLIPTAVHNYLVKGHNEDILDYDESDFPNKNNVKGKLPDNVGTRQPQSLDVKPAFDPLEGLNLKPYEVAAFQEFQAMKANPDTLEAKISNLHLRGSRDGTPVLEARARTTSVQPNLVGVQDRSSVAKMVAVEPLGIRPTEKLVEDPSLIIKGLYRDKIPKFSGVNQDVATYFDNF